MINEGENLNTQAPHQYSDAALGVFSTLAIILLCWGFFWFRQINPLQPSQHVNVIFNEVANLNDNAAVFINGVRVGQVEKLELLNKDKVLVRLRISKGKIKLSKAAKFHILTNGVVGARYVEIVLPEPKDDRNPTLLADNDTMLGETPVRPELAINKLAMTFSSIDMAALKKGLNEDRQRLARAADQMTLLANHTIPVLDRIARDLSVLTRELTYTSKKVNKVISNPKFSEDIRVAMNTARETVDKVKEVAKQVQETLGDKELRTDIVTALNSLSESTENINKSLGVVQEMAGDKELRTDLKEILTQAKDTLQKVENVVSQPSFGHDLKMTLQESRETLHHVNVAAKQMNQILDKKRPLLHLLFGRPGHLKDAKQQIVEKDVKKQ